MALTHQALAQQTYTLPDLAYEVRVVRYAATGNKDKIEGNEDTPAERQLWLNDIAAALGEASMFFYEDVCNGLFYDDIQGWHLEWDYDPIPLSVTGTGAGGAITQADIVSELAKVTWIVKPDPDLPYGLWSDVIKHSLPSPSFETDWALAAQMAVGMHTPWVIQEEPPAPERLFCHYGWANSSEIDWQCWYTAQCNVWGVAGRWKAPDDKCIDPTPGAGGGGPPRALVRMGTFVQKPLMRKL